MKEETTGFVEIISYYPACATCSMRITLNTNEMDWLKSFVSGKGLFQLVLRWEGLVSGCFGSFRLVSSSFG